MNWIDIRVRKPTKADADKFCRVLVAFGDESIGVHDWGWIATKSTSCIAWMPLSDLPKFVPIHDPPEGYRFKQEGDECDGRALRWSADWKAWICVSEAGEFTPSEIYTVPIDPPKPQYRPFANAAEFEPYESKRWRYKNDLNSTVRMPKGYSDCGHYGDKWDDSFIRKEFTDGTPFGLPV